MDELAINGGTPVRSRPLPPQNTIGAEEKQAVMDVLDSGVLSKFLGTHSEEFFGGPRVLEAERRFAELVGARHAIAVNSATTALEAAVQAVGVAPGDEVIVSPYTMSASAAAILRNAAIPVFADVEDETYGLDPAAVAAAVTPRTRAILVTHLFGHPARMDELCTIADQYGLAIIEDAAQSIGASYHGRLTSSIGTAGVISLNRHKIIQSGEGGLVVTSDDTVAQRAQLVRNHGETVVDDAGWVDQIEYSLGSNYRMTEIEAAIATTQLERLDGLLEVRRNLATALTERLSRLEGITPPVVGDGCTHSYYMFAVRLTGTLRDDIGRAMFAQALRAEGIPVAEGYVRPLYLQSIYQQRSARPGGFPWSLRPDASISYEPGICPTVERLHAEELITLDVCRTPLEPRDIEDVAWAFEKVVAGAGSLLQRV